MVLVCISDKDYQTNKVFLLVIHFSERLIEVTPERLPLAIKRQYM